MAISFSNYEYLVKAFSEEKIKGRYDFIKQLMEIFIQTEGIGDYVYINSSNLEHMIMDYFSDVYRLKEFHEIQKINEDKITAYTIFWILKRSPIQVKKEFADDSSFDSPAHINEKFVTGYLQSYLFSDDYFTSLLEDKQRLHEEFFKVFCYSCKFRDLNVYAINMAITAYRAGRAFQYSQDIAKVNPKDIDPKDLNPANVDSGQISKYENFQERR